RAQGGEHRLGTMAQGTDNPHAGNHHTSPHYFSSSRRTTRAAHWPISVKDTFSTYGFSTSRRLRATSMGQSGSGSSQLSVGGTVPFLSASKLPASSMGADAAPQLPK